MPYDASHEEYAEFLEAVRDMEREPFADDIFCNDDATTEESENPF
jgi:hypothetical protein